jgi:hypothetical protein
LNVRIDKSEIHGRGVFAKGLIEEGDWQFVYGELRVVYPGDPFEHYGVEWDANQIFMPYAPWCCLNHSDAPNCEIGDGDKDHLIVCALRDIEPNEELTISYGYDPSKN